ncbi:MAG: hypothetical protein ACRD59_14590 [Candidatus Acidiferrales bacterium]
MKYRYRWMICRSKRARTRKSILLQRAAVLSTLYLTLSACVFAQSTPATIDAKPAAPAAPASLPHDQHDGLTLSVDPYTEPARTKEKFGKANPVDAGILPVEVFLHNDSDQPMRLDLDTVQLEVTLRNGIRQEVDWLRPEEVANLIAHPGGSADPQKRRLPLPIVIADKKVEKLAAILRPLSLDADVVPPKATVHGFLYFNVSGELSLANSSSLYVPDVVNALSNKPLVFFEVPLRNPAPKADPPAAPSE